MKSIFSYSVLFLLSINTCLASYNLVQLRLSSTQNNYYDETAIRYMGGATAAFDGSYDAWKLFSPNPSVPSLYSKDNSTNDLAINSVNEALKDTVMELYYRTNQPGNYTLEAFNLSLEQDTYLFLEDTQNGQFFDLSSGALSFYLDSSSTGNARFKLHISLPFDIVSENSSCYNSNDGSISIAKPGNSAMHYTFMDENQNIISDGDINEFGNIDNITKGNFILKIDTYGQSEFFNISIEEPEPIQPEFSSIDSVLLNNGGDINFSNETILYDNLHWDFGDGNASTDVNPIHTYQNENDFVVTLTAELNGCSESISKTVTVYEEVEAPNAISKEVLENIKIIRNDNNLQFSGLGKDNYQVNISTINGSNVFTRLINDQENVTHNLSNGIYLITISNGLHTISKKMYL